MYRYPTHLKFDRSGSAIIRFCGDIRAEVGIHPMPDGDPRGVPQCLLACPDSIGIGDASCSACSVDPPMTIVRRVVVTGWDVAVGRWCIYMCSFLTFEIIMGKIAPEWMDGFVRGDGPDVIIQRDGRRVLVEAMPETIGSKRHDGMMPPIGDFLEGLQKRSRWA